MISTQAVIDWLGLDSSRLEPQDLAALDMVIASVNEYVDSLPNIDRTPVGGWAGTTIHGAVMLAARMYRRKNSPAGIEAVGDMTTYVSRYDSDIARLLYIDSFRKPMVG